KHAQQRQARRIAGIVSAVKHGRCGNSAWGRAFMATKGGNALAAHAPQHLQRIALLGVKARQDKREGKKHLEAWEQAPQTPQTYAQWQRELQAEPEPPRDWLSL